MDIKKAFEILDLEETADKKKIKIAYSKLLKKYHPEEFPVKFMEINEAYEKALEYTNNQRIDENFGENNYSEKSFGKDNENYEEYDEIFNGEQEKNLENDAQKWMQEFKIFITSPIRSLNDWKILILKYKKKLKSNFLMKSTKIKNIIFSNNNLSKITEIEKDFLILDLSESNKSENLLKIIEDYKSDDKNKKERALEKFITEYFYVKKIKISKFFFRLFNIKQKKLFPKNKILEKFYDVYYNVRYNILSESVPLNFSIINHILLGKKKTEENAFKYFHYLLSIILFFFLSIYSYTALEGLSKKIWHENWLANNAVYSGDVGIKNTVKYFINVPLREAEIVWVVSILSIMAIDILLLKLQNNFEWTNRIEIADFLILGAIIYVSGVYTVYQRMEILIIIGIAFLIIKKILFSILKFNKLKSCAKSILDTFVLILE